MYEIKKNSRTLEDGTKITTYSREIESCNILEVEAGTTGYRGGDTSRSSSRCQSRHHATMTLSVSIPNKIRSISRRLWKTSRNIRII